ncbi:SHC binding and spindle associated nessun dorma isoform X2 [Arctopsyche grandis]
MSYTVWRFEYNVQERIEALRDVLVQTDACVRPSYVRREWLYRAQIVLEPAGWYALWRLPRESCQKFGVRFPCIVYVLIEGLDLNEDDLLAQVEVVGVQDESVHLPERSVVPLQDLWATRAQPNTALEMRPTAEFIDMYRYFYTLIWMPWDLEEDERDSGRCWFEHHVPMRCELWASALNGHGCDPNAMRALRSEGELILQHIARIEEGMSSDSEDQLEMNSDNVSALMGLHERLQTVRARWEMLQNPILQNVWTSAINQGHNVQTEVTVVWTGGAIQAHIACLKAADEWMLARKVDKKKQVGCASSLIAAFSPKPVAGAVVLLCEGSHNLPNDIGIGNNYTVASVSPNISATVLKPSEFCTTAISISGTVEISGLTIDPAFSSTTIAVRLGKLMVKSCSITATPESQMQSLVAYPKSVVTMKKCTVNKFFTGIIAHSESKIELHECIFDGCGVALHVYEGAQVSLVRCTFKNYSEVAIRYETALAPGTSVGGSNLLQNYNDITLVDCTFSSKNKNEVYVTHLDEFACPQLEDVIAL